MAKLLFYRQKRFDGGIRTGLEIDDATLVEQFDPVPGEPDPYLRWYVDVKCEGPAVPADPDRAEDWFVERRDVLREKLLEYAKKIGHGVDVGLHSLNWNAQSLTGEDAQITIICSTADHQGARELPSILNDLAERWDEIMDSLELTEPAKR
jgi:hypothetical protein